ncbi:hypothetical protein IHE44_0001342 [Lamprotornis superbus]|uniref:Uncharacterized protein n=1 Tax=Lamprotornis superbus TaxID=245042 RepID=A0A835TML7_9PASS|nr:hypothetical protein IHE44_0001342 [Lamprotornis superbus]
MHRGEAVMEAANHNKFTCFSAPRNLALGTPRITRGWRMLDSSLGHRPPAASGDKQLEEMNLWL